MHIMVLHNVRVVTCKVLRMQCREELKARCRINEAMQKKILPEKCPILNIKRSPLKSLDSNIASFKVSREVCSIFR